MSVVLRNINFWLRNMVIAIILLGVAYTFISNQDLFLSFGDSTNKSKEDNRAKAPEKSKPSKEKSASNEEKVKADQSKKNKPKKKKKESTNSAADGLSRMYSNLHGDNIGKNGPQIRNNIVYLPPRKGDLTQILKTREVMVEPYKDDWQGETKLRRFTAGDILIQKLVEHTQKENIKLFWWLERDFVVKNPFIVNKNLLVTVYQTAKSVEGHFPSGISVFFCPKHRSIAVIETAPHAFLDKECALLTSEKPKT